nr:MAG: internal scaffolding protein [Microvirus sp.]
MKPVIPFIRSPYNYDRDSASSESGLLCEDVSLTVQSERDDCDINVIMERFGHGVPLPESLRVPTYGDFTGVSDYRSALDLISEADESFMQLPADVRSRFQNDPARFVDFCSDPSNLDELRKLGLADAIHPPASQEPSQSGSVNPAHAEPKP